LSERQQPVPTPSIGKFQVIGQLGRGGMADVFVCRLQGIGGFDKEVVLKRIIPERAGDPHFVKMFLDEARVVANLNHPNIVQVFEIGEQDGIPFMAMEYVRGITLGMIIREAHRKQKLHYGHAAHLIAGICDALDHAHNALGADGEPMGLVHRDVTPGNIIVSREGTPKLLDFGVARARGRLAQTEAGTIKGKLRYMAPEQISQGALDQRADIFSLGVCLFELTTGQHPFGSRANSEVATLKNIVHGMMTRPSALVPEFPPALEWIVMSALEQDVAKRCPTAAELRERLDSFMAASGYTSNSREVVAWLRDLFPDFSKLTAPTSSSASFPSVQAQDLLPRTPPGTRRHTALGEALGEPGATENLDGSPSFQLTVNEVSHGGGRKRPVWTKALVAMLVLSGAGGAAYLLKPHLLPPAPAPVVSELAPAPPPAPAAPAISDDEAAAAYLEAAEKLVGEKRFEPALEMLSKAKQLTIRRPDLNIRLTNLNDSLTTSVLIKKASGLVKDKQYREAAEAAKEALDRDPENKEAIQILSSVRSALEPKTADSGKAKERARDGFLSVTTNPPAMVYVDDTPIGRSPITRFSLSSGEHLIQVRAQGYRPTQTEVKVSPRQTLALVLPLAAEGAPASSSRPVVREEEAPRPEVPLASGRLVAASAGPAAEREREPEPEPTTRPRPPASPPSAPSPAPVAAIKPAPVSPPAPAASAATPGNLISATPKSPIPKPTLPRAFTAADAEQLGRACQLVESTIISVGGVSPEWARGITGPLRRLAGVNAEVYPVAMYYFLIREAALKHDHKSAAAGLASAHANGTILKFRNLPAVERGL
jgi:eukaryotic-like serine/threonine-protein kinase